MTKIFNKVKNITGKIIAPINNFFDFIYKWFSNWFSKHNFIVMIIIVLVLALIARFAFVELTSGDTYWFLVPWVKFIRDNGGLLSLKELPISYYVTTTGNVPYGMSLSDRVVTSVIYGNYPVFYYFLLALLSYLPFSEIVIIKMLSFIFDIILAFGVLKIAEKVTKSKLVMFISFTLSLILPTVLINSAVWGQCDATYVGLIVWSVYFLLVDKPKISMIFIGFAFAIKIQTIFILPLYGLLFLKGKFKLRYFLITALVMFISLVPSYIAGAEFLMPIKQLYNSASSYSSPNMNSGSFYAILSGMGSRLTSNVTIFGTKFVAVDLFGIPIALLILLSAIYVVYRAKIEINNQSIIAFAALSALLVPFVLPHMHDRYFFLADIFVLIYVLVNKKPVYYIILSQVSSLLAYANFILGGFIFPTLGNGNLVIACLINAFLIVMVTKDILTMKKEPPLLDDLKIVD